MARTRAKKKPATDTNTSEQPATSHEHVADPTVESKPAEPQLPPLQIKPESVVDAPIEAAPAPASEQPRPEATERQASHENGHASHSDHGHAARHQQHREHGHAANHIPEHVQGQPRADAIGKRPDKLPGYTGVITDTLAGARFLEHRNPFLSIIRFEEKPSDKVREKLREEGFDWNQRNEEWKRPINYETRQQDRITAERTFEDVTKIIRTERGITHSFGGAA